MRQSRRCPCVLPTSQVTVLLMRPIHAPPCPNFQRLQDDHQVTRQRLWHQDLSDQVPELAGHVYISSPPSSISVQFDHRNQTLGTCHRDWIPTSKCPVHGLVIHKQFSSSQFPRSTLHTGVCITVRNIFLFFLLTLICLSSAPVAKCLPSGLKLTERIYKSPSLSAFVSCSTLRITVLAYVDLSGIGSECIFCLYIRDSVGIVCVVDICSLITSGCHVATVCTEFDAANHTGVIKSVKKLNFKVSRYFGIEPTQMCIRVTCAITLSFQDARTLTMQTNPVLQLSCLLVHCRDQRRPIRQEIQLQALSWFVLQRLVHQQLCRKIGAMRCYVERSILLFASYVPCGGGGEDVVCCGGGGGGAPFIYGVPLDIGCCGGGGPLWCPAGAP